MVCKINLNQFILMVLETRFSQLLKDRPENRHELPRFARKKRAKKQRRYLAVTLRVPIEVRKAQLKLRLKLNWQRQIVLISENSN